MYLIDRTTEFNSIISSIQSVTPPPKKENVSSSSPFAEAASQVAKTLVVNLSRLQTLTKLVKSSTVLDDKSSQINNLSQQIRFDLGEIQKTISYLDQNAKGKKSQRTSHHNAMVSTLKVSLFDTTISLEEQLKTHNSKLADMDTRKQSFNISQPSLLSQDFEPVSFLDNTEVQQQKMLEAVTIISNNERIQERARQIEEIEKSVSEIQSLYNRMATYVQQGNESLQRIDQNIDDTFENLGEAQRFLQRALQRSKGNKMLIAKIIGMFIIFGIIFSFIR